MLPLKYVGLIFMGRKILADLYKCLKLVQTKLSKYIRLIILYFKNGFILYVFLMAFYLLKKDICWFLFVI